MIPQGIMTLTSWMILFLVLVSLGTLIRMALRANAKSALKENAESTGALLIPVIVFGLIGGGYAFLLATGNNVASAFFR